MAVRSASLERLQDELVDACSRGDVDRARTLVSKLGEQPRQARALLDAMLKHPDAQVRQAAAFGLGELGDTASARLLEQQLAIEETRGDYDGASVVGAIVGALGRIEEAGVRATLVRRLEKLAAGKPEPSDVFSVVHALWRKRHPELLPVVRRSLEQLPAARYKSLLGLFVLLDACTGPSRAPIPAQGEHPFRSKVSTRSGDAERAFRAR